MDETGEWKQDLIRTRTCPLVFTFYGCCGCEVSLPKGAEHPDWNYVRRNLTNNEHASFHDEYGRQAELLLHLEISKNLNIRGFVLNGRKLGWNLSVGHA
jgi:Ni,Fe-hydrogenase I small subunit